MIDDSPERFGNDASPPAASTSTRAPEAALPVAASEPAAATDFGAQVVFSKLAMAGVGLAALVSYFIPIGLCPFIEPDEPRYAEIAREMIELRDWVTPHLNYVKYFEKPPLVYWLTAAAQTILGSGEWAARLVPVFFALLGIASVAMLGRVMFGRGVGFLAASILAATPLYFALGQVLILDMPLTTLMTLGFLSFWMAYRSPRRRYAWTLCFYAMLGLGMLTKGPVAVVLTGGVLLPFLLLRRDLASLRWLLSPSAIGLFFIVAIPWFLLVSWRNPEFVDFFFVKQHLDRYLHPDEHQQSLFFFVPILLAGMLPWSFVFLAAPYRARDAFNRLLRLRVGAATLYCLLWAGVIFLFFSLSGSKLATYILPVFPPLAILAGRFLAQLIHRQDVSVFRRSARLFQVLAALFVIGGAVVVFIIEPYQSWIVVPRLAMAALILAVAAHWLLHDHSLAPSSPVRMKSSYLIVVIAALGLQTVALSGRAAGQHYEQLGETIRTQARPQDLVVLYGHYTQGIAYYSKRRITMAVGWGELGFGSRQGDQSKFFWPKDEQLVDAWNGGQHLFLVINRSELEPLKPRLLPAPREIAAQDKKVLVVNFPS